MAAAVQPLHPPSGRLVAWLRPTWMEQGPGLVDPSGIDRQSLASSITVDRVGDVTLTEEGVASYLLSIEWIAGSALLPSDIVELRQALLDRFGNAPHQTIEQVDEARALPKLVTRLSPVERAQLRHRMRTAVADRARRRGAADPVADCLARRDPVHPVEGTPLIITAEACTTWRLRRQLVAHIAGTELVLADGPPDDVACWARPRQHDLAQSTVHFTAVRAGLRRLGPDQQREVADALVDLVHGPASLEATTVALTTIMARPVPDPAADIRSRAIGLRPTAGV